MTDDEKQLNLLSIFHYLAAGVTALFACFPLIHVAVGLVVILGGFDGKNPPPPLLGWLFIVMGGIFFLCGWALAVAILIAGRKLKRRASYTYCVVVGALECILMPYGTVLGVFTLVVLMRDPVKQLFEARAASGAAASPVNYS